MTVAMLFLIEATGVCGPVAPARLGGGAEVVRAVLDFEDEGAEMLAPTLAGLSQSSADVPIDPSRPEANQDAGQCSLVPTAIA